MLIKELYDPVDPGYYSEKGDNSALKLSDVRKTRLSLEQINRLRSMNDVRKFEHQKKLNSITKQYKPPAEPAPGGI
jgi:hypothetical protein